MTELTVCGGHTYNDYHDSDYYNPFEDFDNWSHLSDENICRTLDIESGEWKVSYQFEPARKGHVAWKNEEGILLMGGRVEWQKLS